MLSNGERRLFFQDNEGVIRQAVRPASSGLWATSPSLNVTSDAKDNTPLAATSLIDVVLFRIEISGQLRYVLTLKQPMLFYITHDHSLNSTAYDGVQWNTGFDIGLHTTAPSSRQLSVTSVRNESDRLIADATPDQLLLFYENPGGNITTLLGSRYVNKSTSCITHQVMDISSRKSLALPPYTVLEFCGPYVNSSLPEITDDYRMWTTLYETSPGSTFSVPFTSAFCSANDTKLKVEALFYTPSTSSILSTFYQQYDYESGFRTGMHQLSIFIAVKRLILFVR